MRELYGAVEPYEASMVPVSEKHSLYVEQCGSPTGVPVLFVHGGPGSCIAPVHRRFFDPSFYRIVLFDQRGCGRSIPRACLEENETSFLIEDIETIRTRLGIPSWHVFGGSWGSALALSYAQAHAPRVRSLILRGIFLVTRRELLWFYQDGASMIFPAEFERFQSIVPEQQRADMITAYYDLLTCPDRATRERAAVAWCTWEAAASFLVPRADYVAKFDDPDSSVPFAAIECHYFRNSGFQPVMDIPSKIDRIRRIPSRIIQGRYDMVCPMETAWLLHRAWPEADFMIVDEAGHSALDERMISELVQATDEMRA